MTTGLSHRVGRAPHGGRPRPSAESGMAGFEVLPFGVLVFVLGSLLALNAWSVVDSRAVAETAAREAARAYVEAPSVTEGRRAALAAAEDVVVAFGRRASDLHLELPDDPGFQRCRRIVVTVHLRAPTVRLPLAGGWGSRTVGAHHTEVIDPLRSGLEVDGRGCY